MYRTSQRSTNAIGLAVIAGALCLSLMVMLPLAGTPAARLLASAAIALLAP